MRFPWSRGWSAVVRALMVLMLLYGTACGQDAVSSESQDEPSPRSTPSVPSSPAPSPEVTPGESPVALEMDTSRGGGAGGSVRSGYRTSARHVPADADDPASEKATTPPRGADGASQKLSERPEAGEEAPFAFRATLVVGNATGSGDGDGQSLSHAEGDDGEETDGDGARSSRGDSGDGGDKAADGDDGKDGDDEDD